MSDLKSILRQTSSLESVGAVTPSPPQGQPGQQLYPDGCGVAHHVHPPNEPALKPCLACKLQNARRKKGINIAVDRNQIRLLHGADGHYHLEDIGSPVNDPNAPRPIYSGATPSLNEDQTEAVNMIIPIMCCVTCVTAFGIMIGLSFRDQTAEIIDPELEENYTETLTTMATNFTTMVGNVSNSKVVSDDHINSENLQFT